MRRTHVLQEELYRMKREAPSSSRLRSLNNHAQLLRSEVRVWFVQYNLNADRAFDDPQAEYPGTALREKAAYQVIPPARQTDKLQAT